MGGLNKSVFLSALLASLLAATLVAVSMLYVLQNRLPEASHPSITSQPGMEILKAMRCPRGEIKRIFLRGIEDQYSPNGHEPARIHDRLLVLEGYKHHAKTARTYDEGGLDKYFFDFMEVPSNISSGIFMMGIQSLASNSHEHISLGDAFDLDYTASITAPYVAGYTVRELNGEQGWTHQNGIYYGALQDLKLSEAGEHIREISTLLAYIQLGETSDNAARIVDVHTSDDIQVDFVAMAVCELPKTTMGLTLAEYTGFQKSLPTIAYLSCVDDISLKMCNPFTGDTQCSAALPMACFKEENLPVPPAAAAHGNLREKWSGGSMAYSPTVRGDDFQTIAQANAYCAAQFGKNWRVLSWHDGGGGQMSVMTKFRKPGQRAWVDIKDQPYGTCWTR